MTILNRQKLLEMTGKLEIAEVNLGDGNIVYVRELNGTERDEYESSLLSQNGKNFKADMTNARAKLVVKTACDKNGDRLFKDTDVVSVGKLPAKVINKIFEKAQDLNKITDEDVEEAVKN